MKLKSVLFLGICILNCFGSWKELCEQHAPLMESDSKRIIFDQLAAAELKAIPKIADQRVKNISIVECGEPLVDLCDCLHERIKAMEGDYVSKAHMFPADIDERFEGHSKMRKGAFEALVRMIGTLDKAACHFGYVPDDLEIHLFEGARDLSVQKKLFDEKMAKIVRDNPKMTEEEAYQETSKWVSPYINNVPAHSTGGAIDIYLWSKSKQRYCDMGRFNTGCATAPMFSEDITSEQKSHRLLFLIAACNAGLVNYPYEFWHFSCGDRYAEYWKNADEAARIACYGGVA